MNIAGIDPGFPRHPFLFSPAVSIRLRRMKAFARSLTALLAALTAPLHAANWPAWRGPAGDGVTTETEIPLTWSATENVRWKIPLPERGNSTPIVWDKRIFVTQAVG